ncbi:type II secretion system F family protein [Novipirellula herctigrandis]|uniref:type II secretion system F family protein n=1 Tax=Novipirellula herctigrandis TaxID=2527986 RepID=UPI003AF3B3D9
MANLSDLQFASLLEEIASAMRGGIPLADSMRRLERNRLGRVSKTASMIAGRLERGESFDSAVQSLDSSLATQVAASVSASEKANSPELIERFAAQLKRRSEYTRSLWFAWFYPLLLVVVGYGVAVFFLAPVIRGNTVRVNYNGEIAWADWVVATADWLQVNWVWPPIVFAVLCLLAYFALRWRDHFPHSVRMGLFCSSLADQISHDVPDDVAIRSAAQLSGDSEMQSIGNPSMQSPEMEQILAQADIPAQAIGNVNQKQLTVSVLHYLAAMYAERSRRHVYLLSCLLPRIAMAVIGGGLAISYVWWVMGPIYRQVAQW